MVYDKFGGEVITLTTAELDVLIRTLENEIALLRAMESQISRVKGMAEEISESL